MAASAEVDALPALCDAPGVSRCEVDYSLLRGLWQQDRADATSARTAASFSSAHRPRPPHITTNRSRVRGGTRICDDRMRSVLRKCALGSRWQESCLSSAAQRSLRVCATCMSGRCAMRKCCSDAAGVLYTAGRIGTLYVPEQSSALSVAQATQMRVSPRPTTEQAVPDSPRAVLARGWRLRRKSSCCAGRAGGIRAAASAVRATQSKRPRTRTEVWGWDGTTIGDELS